MSSSSNLSKFEKEKQKLVQEKCLALLNEMLQDDDNKYCIDCDAKGPRWASYNLGIFLCIRCAGIHRNLGVHISKVRSVNLDSWTPEMVVSMQQMGNSKGRAVYEANIPDNFRRPQTDVALENFIRAKYEHKKYIAQEFKPTIIGKVNWDAEIEESIKKKKEIKRQQLNDNNNIGLFPTTLAKPKIPPPTNSSSSSTTSAKKQPQPQDKTKKENEIKSSTTTITTTASEDLLGLSSGLDDLNLSSTTSNGQQTQIQSELLSVGASTNTNESSGDPFASPLKSGSSTTSNQDDLGGLFLSNSAGDGVDNSLNLNSKMSKDSILSLYGQGATSPINPFGNPNMFGQQGQQFQPQQQQQQQSNNMFNQMMGQPAAQAINLNDPMKVGGGLFDIQQQLQGLNMNIPASNSTPNFNPVAQQQSVGSTNLMGNFGNFQQSSQQFPIPQQQNLMMNNPANMFSGANPLMTSANNSFYPPQFQQQNQQPPPAGTGSTNLNQPMFSNGSLSNIWK